MKNQQLSGQGAVASSSPIKSSSDLLDAKLEGQQLCGFKHCPGCGHKLDGKPDWLGLPAGVKFDPTDQELIEHLEAKVESINGHIKSHPLIDEFIPTIEGEDGICYTHPEKLPGVTRDGLSRHFFHRPSKAYTTGTRKRRKIQTECCDPQAGGETRWHKTGKTRPVLANSKQKGCKKILVLYTNFGKNRKPEKTNWVMHQYHLGQHEEEKEGELVVSKIFYQTQPRQCNWVDRTSSVVPMADGSATTGADAGRKDSGSGSCSSSKDNVQLIVVPQHHLGDGDQLRDRQVVSAAVAAALSNFGGMEMQQHLKTDPLFTGFLPIRKVCDEVGLVEVATSATTAGEQVQASTSGTCQEHDLGQQQYPHSHHRQPHQQQPPQLSHQLTAAFHISRLSPPISTIISPPPPPPLHTCATSILLNHQDPYRSVSGMIIQNESNYNQQQQGMRSSASSLEELIMGCSSNSSGAGGGGAGPGGDIKAESSMSNPQEAEWLKYSSFWNDPDDHHHNHHHDG